MTLPTSGPLSLSQVNTENGYATATVVSLNDSAVRSLAGKLSGQIGFNDLLGKSNDGIVASYYFNGSNNGIRMSTNSNLVIGSNDFTFEFWMKANTTQNQNSVILSSSTDNSGTNIAIDPTGKLTFDAQANQNSQLITANTVTDNAWHHIACIKFNNKGYLFRDGILEANTANGAWSVMTNVSLTDGNIGRSRFDTGNNSTDLYTGWLSNLRVAKRAMYTQNFTVPNRVLAPVPNTQLLTVRNTTVVDDSGNNLILVANTVFPTLVLDTVPPISATYPVTIASDIANANVYNLAKTAGWDANNGLVVATVNSGVTVSSSSTGAYAMTIDGGFWGGVKLVNNGTIVGRGGDAGGGGSAPAYNSGYAGGAGASGGPALFVGRPLILKNAGRIAGGGGGGGGGGATGGQYYYSYYYTYTAAARDSYYGAVYYYTVGATGYATVYYTDGGGGGGGGIGVSAGGAGGTAGSSNYPSNGTAGSGGTISAQGAGAPSGGVPGYYYLSGAGGSGGAYGSSGGGGGVGNGNVFNASGGAAGAAGSAIVGYSKISIQSVGTINGATSG